MAITILQKKSGQKYLILIFGLLIVFIVLVLWSGFFKKSASSLFVPEAAEPRKIEINFEILKIPFLKEALPFESIKPFEETKLPDEETKLPEKIGRDNPFLPY